MSTTNTQGPTPYKFETTSTPIGEMIMNDTDTKEDGHLYFNYNPPSTSGFTVRPAESTEWKCELFGGDNGITWTPRINQVPCWFWRKMQYLCFGNKWVKGGRP